MRANGKSPIEFLTRQTSAKARQSHSVSGTRNRDRNKKLVRLNVYPSLGRDVTKNEDIYEFLCMQIRGLTQEVFDVTEHLRSTLDRLDANDAQRHHIPVLF